MQPLQVRNAFVEPEVEDTGSGLTLDSYLNILKRRKAIVIQSFIVILLIGTVITLLTKPVYQATARLLVDGQSLSINTVDDSNPLSGILALSQEQDVSTQVEELQAAPLLGEVKQRVGDATLSVAEVRDTNVIEVTSEANKPDVAANAANVLLQTYIDEDVDRNLTEIRNAESFAVQKEADAHRRLLQTEQEIRAFRQATQVPDVGQGLTMQLGLVSTLQQQVEKDQANLHALQSQINASKRILAHESQTFVVNVPAPNPLIAALQTQLSQLKVQRISLTQKGGFTASAPQVLSVDAQIADVERQLKSTPPTINTVVGSANSNYQTLAASVESLEGQAASQSAQLSSDQQALASAQSGAGKYPNWQLQLDTLQREHDTAESDDKMFSDKIADLSLREQAHHSSAHILEPASAPSLPVRPKRVTSIFFAGLIGLFVGIVLAFLQEFLDDRVNSVEEASRFLGASSLGLIPTIDDNEPKLLTEMKGLDAAAESYRMLRTNIHFSAVDAPVHTLLVTSAGPGEGKTTTATNMAFAMALDGKKVILVDTDLRRPSLHKLLSLPVAPGLTDVLLGHASLQDTLQPHPDFANMSSLCSGSTPPNPGELLNSRTFRALIDQLKGMADVVIFDSAPVLVAADSAILASQVDGTVFVVEAGGTKKTAAKRAMQILHQARASMLGVIYNKMSPQEGDGYYYYRYNYHTMLPEGHNGARNGTSAGVKRLNEEPETLAAFEPKDDSS